MSENKTIAALEMGTCKTQVFVGEVVSGGGMNIVGMGREHSSGVKKGDVTDIHKAAKSVLAALSNAEKTIGDAVLKSVCLGISGTHLKGFENFGSANVSGSDSIVREHDIERAREDARSKILPQGRTYIHRICCGYYLDNTRFVQNPIGEKASHIDAVFWMIHGDSEKISDAMHIVESFNMSVDYMAFSGIASGRMVTTSEQRETGTLVIDMGCGTSDYAFFKYGKPIQACTVPLGGDHLTNDLAFGLRMNTKNAERIKTRFGKAVIGEDERNMKIWTEGDKQIGDREIPFEAINKILRARLEETFLLVREEMTSHFTNGAVKEIVLTGGGSKLKGVRALAESAFGVKCSLGKFDDGIRKDLHHPDFATSLGLLDFARAETLKQTKAKKKSLFGKIFGK